MKSHAAISVVYLAVRELPDQGILQRLRCFQFLLICVLAIGQVHLCRPTYELPTGQVCITCPELVAEARVAAEGQGPSIGERDGDCLDCCVLAACENDSGDSPVLLAGSYHFEIPACIPPRLEIPDISSLTFWNIVIHVETAPSLGPPSQTSSRAPPHAANSLPSAGRRFMNVG